VTEYQQLNGKIMNLFGRAIYRKESSDYVGYSLKICVGIYILND
jgi:hypothetical protein